MYLTCVRTQHMQTAVHQQQDGQAAASRVSILSTFERMTAAAPAPEQACPPTNQRPPVCRREDSVLAFRLHDIWLGTNKLPPLLLLLLLTAYTTTAWTRTLHVLHDAQYIRITFINTSNMRYRFVGWIMSLYLSSGIHERTHSDNFLWTFVNLPGEHFTHSCRNCAAPFI